MRICAVLLVLAVTSHASAQQCENGVCLLPARGPVANVARVAVNAPVAVVRSAVAVPVQIVTEVQPVRTTASYFVRRKPVRRAVGGTLRITARVATAPVRFIRNRQPVRSIFRRAFCR